MTLEKILQTHLANKKLDCYTAVVLARRDLENHDIKSAIFRLAQETDKLRPYDPVLVKFVLDHYMKS